MADNEREFEHESLQDRATIARYLKAIEEGFANGSLSLRSKDGDILLEPQGLIGLTVKASRKRGRMQLSLQASWKTTGHSETDRPNTLTISTNGS